MQIQLVCSFPWVTKTSFVQTLFIYLPCILVCIFCQNTVEVVLHQTSWSSERVHFSISIFRSQQNAGMSFRFNPDFLKYYEKNLKSVHSVLLLNLAGPFLSMSLGSLNLLIDYKGMSISNFFHATFIKFLTISAELNIMVGQ